MPCSDSVYRGDDERKLKLELLKSRLDKVTDMLCITCKYLENKNIEIPLEVVEWWSEHKEWDAQRKPK